MLNILLKDINFFFYILSIMDIVSIVNTNDSTVKSDSVNDINVDQIEIANKTTRLKKIKSKIENMDKSNQIAVLFMVTKNKNIKYSENSNGTFINLTEIQDSMLLKLEEFIAYTEIQKHEIENIENKKEYIENIYFKQNKD